jgi:hypothetical protein
MAAVAAGRASTAATGANRPAAAEAAALAETDWAARAEKAEGQLMNVRTYLEAKRDRRWQPPRELMGEAGIEGARGSSAVIRNYLEYTGEVDKLQAKGIERHGDGRPYPVMTPQQRAEAAEWAVKRLMAKAVTICRRDGLCDYGIKELSVATGIPMPGTAGVAQFQLTFAVEIPADIPFGGAVDGRAVRAKLDQVLSHNIKPALTRTFNNGAAVNWAHGAHGEIRVNYMGQRAAAEVAADD